VTAGEPTIAIVTDSTADIPPEQAEPLAIRVVPALLIFEGETYRDGEGITRQDLYSRMPELAKMPTTAAPSPHFFAEAYEAALTEGAETVLSMHLSAKLSGIFNAASQAARPFRGRVHVYDSLQVSMGLGFQVLETARAALQGKGLEEVSAVAHRARSRAHLMAMIDTLEYLRRSGRVNWLRAGVGDLLQVKLLVEIVDGLVQAAGRVRTQKKAIQHLMNSARDWSPFSHLAVLHTAAQEKAAELAGQLADLSATAPLVVEATTVIGTHVGPNAIGVAGLSA
jgi:DegV family protein with EDD domain